QTLLPDQLHCTERCQRFRIGREALLSRSGFGEEQVVPQCRVEQYRSLRQVGKAAGVALAFEWVLDPAVTYLSADRPLPAEDQAYQRRFAGAGRTDNAGQPPGWDLAANSIRSTADNPVRMKLIADIAQYNGPGYLAAGRQMAGSIPELRHLGRS